MKIINQVSTLIVLSFTLLLAIANTGCQNNAANGEETHHTPFGAVLYMNGSEIVRYEGPSSINGSIEVAEGEETALITIYFLDEDGEEFQPDDPENSLDWIVGNESVAEIEQHSEDGKWSFHVVGISGGSTTVTFSLMHEDHSDFDAAGIPINVN